MTDSQLASLAKEMVEQESPEACVLLSEFAERCGPAAVDLVKHFTAALRSLETRDFAAFGLAAIGPESYPAVPELLAAMRYEPENYCISPFVVALGSIGPSAVAAVPHLIETLRASWEDWDWLVARDAATALARIGAREAMPHLELLLDLDSPAVLQAMAGGFDPATTRDRIQEARGAASEAIRLLSTPLLDR